MLELFCPTMFYNTIYDIDFDELKGKGIQGLIVDFDNTLVARGSREAPDELNDWLEELKAAGFRICVVSNNWERKVEVVVRKLGMPIVAQAGKPRRKAFEQGMKILGTKDAQTAVVGDQLFTDVLGGNRLGLVTILVVPIGTNEMLHTKLLRRLERQIIKKLRQRKMLVHN